MKWFITYFLVFIFTLFVNAQTLRNLSNAEQDQIARLEEMAELYVNDNDAVNAGQTYARIAFIYWKAQHPREAIDKFISSAELLLQANRLNEVKNVYTNIGVIYTDLEELEFALEYFNKSLDIRRRIGSKNEISAGLVDVAYVLQLLNYNDDAVEKLNEALKLATATKNSTLILDCYQMLSDNYEKTGNIKKSQEFSSKYESFQSYVQEENIKNTYTEKVIETQQQVAKTEAEKRLATQVFALKQQLYQRKQDSLNLSLKAKQDSLFQAARIAKERQMEIDLLNKQKQLQQLELKQQEVKAKNQRLILTLVLGGFIVVAFISIFIFRANRQKKKANKLLEQQNKEIAEKSEQLSTALKVIAHKNQSINQSINYAKGIQEALLPKPVQFKELFNDAFILFKPRDVVSGDFYWFTKLDAKSDIFKIFGMHRLQEEKEESEDEKQNKKIAVSAVDCTGHGVPGAFMSMIGYNLLDEITGRGITRPDLILEEMHRGVRMSLKQKETNNQDGMDMALCVIDPVKKTMEFAGANNPVIYVQDNQVFQIKGDKNGIGGKSDDHKFTLHTIDVSKPTWVYLFSDGYIDQFGGEHGRKFMIKRFREILYEIHSLSMEEQKEYLDKTIVEWIGSNYSQIDDILVIGFKMEFS